MNQANGVFIVLEGSDGSGKHTQFKLLKERLRAVGYEVEVFEFPRYHKTSSHFVRRYLNGDYGPAKDVNPYTAALFYALDRFEAAPAIRKALAAGKIVLADRYVGSNMAHQGGKLNDSVQQRGFFVWVDGLEFQLLGIPRPDYNFYLRVPAETAFQLIKETNKRGYTGLTHDEHEKDINHLRRSTATYDMLCQLFPKDFLPIECSPSGKLLSVAEVNDLLWEKLRPILPQTPPHAAHDVIVRFNESEKDSAPTDPTTSPRIIDSTNNKIINLNIKKVSLLTIGQIQAYGEVKSEITSIDWPRDEKYTYYTPRDLPKNVIPIYKASMQKLIQLHRQMNRIGGKNPGFSQILKSCTPLASLASARISGTPDQLRGLTKHLQFNPLAEARWLSGQIATAGQKLYPQDFKVPSSSRPSGAPSRTDPPDDVIAKLVAKHLPQTLTAQTEQVSLQEAHPRNEFDLLLDGLYSYSTASRADIAADIDQWSYQQKKQALQAAAAQTDAKLLGQATYLWNIICDRSTFEQLSNIMMIEEPKMQPATPRYGYEVPQAIEESEACDDFLECFDESLKLFSSLQAAGREDVAAYATLVGHKNRWQLRTSAFAVKSAGNSANPQLKELIGAMREKIKETHPLLGEFISTNTSRGQTNKKSRSKKRTRKPKNDQKI